MWTGIELLLILQDIRLQNPFLEDLFLHSSSKLLFLALPVMVISAFFWFVDKRQGTIIGLGFTTATATAIAAKFCIAQPRPWILDPRIIQVPGSYASGYSCPSTHTTMVASALFPAAYYSKDRVLTFILLAVAIFVITGRLVLCAHTPLDLLVALIITFASLVVARIMVDYGNRGEMEFYISCTAYLIVISAIVIVAIALWNADLPNMIGHASLFYGAIVGMILEHRYLGYTIPSIDVRSIFKRYIVGMVLSCIIFFIPYLLLGEYGTAAGGFLVMLWIFYGYPRLMMTSGWISEHL